MNNCDVAIIGAGPYGLSTAAHLKAHRVGFRIFGKAMQSWLEHMPEGMHLKSEGFASSLCDPESTFPLGAYCKEKNVAYSDIGTPVPLDVFSSYGLEFQRRFVPELESKRVASVQRLSVGFRITLDDGEVFAAQRVVVAVGLTYYAHVPPELSVLPAGFVTHSSKHGPLKGLNGREVAVVGAGASALDLAALLHQAGASVQVIARVPKIRFHDPPENLQPSWLDRLRTPITGIGPGWTLFMYVNLPLGFRLMPERFRLDRVRRILGPAPCWFTKEQVLGKVGFNLGVNITAATLEDGRVRLQLTDKSGASKALTVDHVISATGYKVDLRRLPFLDSKVLSEIQSVEQTPLLSSNFESTVPNLYFIGITAANTFGPMLRFAYGAGFAAPRLSNHLARSATRDPGNRYFGQDSHPETAREESGPVLR